MKEQLYNADFEGMSQILQEFIAQNISRKLLDLKMEDVLNNLYFISTSHRDNDVYVHCRDFQIFIFAGT